jgi:hypothetical protein
MNFLNPNYPHEKKKSWIKLMFKAGSENSTYIVSVKAEKEYAASYHQRKKAKPSILQYLSSK